MSKTFKKFFAGLLAFVMVFAMTAVAAPKAEVKADEEKYEMFLAIGAAEDWSMCYDNAPDYAGDIIATNASVAVGETATISLVMPREVDKTWYLAPVLLAEGVQDLDYTISSITLDGAEILDTVNLNAREAGNWWYEATGVFTDKQAIRLAGGYNEWGDKFMAEGPTGWTEISYTITLNKVEKAPEFEMFVGIGAAEDWSMCYDNAPDYAGDIVATKAMVSEGETVTIGLTMPREVDYTWYVAPVLVAEGVEKLDYTINSITLDGAEILGDVNLDARADGNWWYEGTGPFTETQAIRLAGGYNEWGDKFMATSPTGWTELYYTITINNIEKAPEYDMFLAIGADTDGGSWNAQYYGGSADDTANMTATTAKVKAGDTVNIGVACDTEITYTWFTRPVIAVDGNAYAVDYTINSITIDGNDVLANVDLAAGDASWAETTGPYTDALCLAGGYNEWGAKYITTAPANYKEIMYNITINSIGPKAGGNVTVVELPDEIEMFIGIGAENAAGAWDMCWANEADNASGIVGTVEKISEGETVTLKLVMPNEVTKTYWFAPTMVVSGVGEMDVTIDSMKFDGEEFIQEVDFSLNPDRGEWWYEGTGNYTAEESLRLACGYNEWADKYLANVPTGWTELEITVTLNSIAPVAPTVSNEIVYTGDVTMFLAGTAESADQAWDWTYANGSTDNAALVGNAVTAKAGDTVTIGVTYPSAVHHTWWLAPTLVLPEAEDGLDKYLVDYTIDKVTIDGADVTDKIDLSLGEKASWYEGTEDHPVTRTIRLKGGYNEWGDHYIAGDLLAGHTNIEYTITINKIYGVVVEEVEGPKADLDGTYNAYVGIQSGAYTFRNAWDDATYGRDTNPEAFGQMSFIETDQTITKKAGSFVDTVIAGNGTYTVEVNDLAWDDGSEALNLLFISTDIPNSGEITFSNIKVDFDGKNVMEFDEAFLDGDSKEVMKVLFINIWNKDITAAYNMAGMLPKSNVKITFDVAGFNYDKAADAEPTPEPTPEPTVAPTEAPAEPTVAPTEAPVATEAPAEPTAAPTEAPADVDADEEGGMSPLVIALIAVAVVAVAGGAAFVVMKNKKK